MDAQPAKQPEKRSDEDLVLEYLPVVRRIARWFVRRMPVNLRPDDLEAAGILGLLSAAQQRDPARPEQFMAYARRKIEGAMLDEVRRQDVLPKDARALSKRIVSAMAQVEKRTGKADEEQVAAELKVSVEEYRWMLERTVDVRLVSLESTYAGQRAAEETPVADPSALEGILVAETCSRVAEAIAYLPLRQRRVLALYYIDELPMREIGQVMNLTAARVTQLHSEAVHRVRALLQRQEREEEDAIGRLH